MKSTDPRSVPTGTTPADRRAAPRTEEVTGHPDHATRPIFDEALALLRREPPPTAPSVAEAAPSSASPPPSEPLPARMLNEFVYCPRLFYYEHVEGLFVENADTLRGTAIHRRVDQGKGDLPPAAAPPPEKPESSTRTAGSPPPEPPATVPASGPAPETIHSRSVSLGSPRLGVVAKLDLVEVRPVPVSIGEQGDLFAALEVCPVDYKAGAPREGADANELWPTDRMQLGVQMLLLRDNGYSCREGLIYYRATRQRVRLALNPELEAWVIGNIAAARQAAAGTIPPPLDDSPKCVRCSLAPVCLPDETRLLARLTEPQLPVEIPTGVSAPQAVPGESAPTPPTVRGRAESAPSPGPVRARATEAVPRRLIAAADDTRALYLNTPGLHVGRRDETLIVKDRDAVVSELRLLDLHHVALFGNIQLTTQALHALCDAGIPITWFSGGGWFYGLTRGHDLRNIFTRIEQFRLARDAAFALRLARLLVHGKIRNQRTLLMRNHVEAPAHATARLRRAADDALQAGSVEELLGIEGAAAATYFEHFAGMLKLADPVDLPNPAEPREPGSEPTPAPPAPSEPRRPLSFDFTKRNRRPPADPVNALLSLAYSLLSKDCTLACYAVGFDPYLGYYHQPRFGRPALALDLMEEFRPLVADSVTLTAINIRIIDLGDFVRAGDAVNLTPAGRKKFFHAYEQRMSSVLTHPVFDYKVSYRRALELQARILARVLTGEIPEYLPLTTR